jgi:hypothetical protein
MKLTKQTIFVVTLLQISSMPAIACSFDTDCNPGSKCAKPVGSLYGACVGGLSPGNSYDREPVYAPLDLNDTYGDTCSFDTDCGPGSVCYKDSGIYGTCL